MHGITAIRKTRLTTEDTKEHGRRRDCQITRRPCLSDDGDRSRLPWMTRDGGDLGDPRTPPGGAIRRHSSPFVAWGYPHVSPFLVEIGGDSRPPDSEPASPITAITPITGSTDFLGYPLPLDHNDHNK